ncbi:unnamed protein product [Amoebophrya sp. A120]|nr:unnamed protein product [Amoebophrya sp. A120]|eukprot:GSA120T00021993001.1
MTELYPAQSGNKHYSSPYRLRTFLHFLCSARFDTLLLDDVEFGNTKPAEVTRICSKLLKRTEHHFSAQKLIGCYSTAGGTNTTASGGPPGANPHKRTFTNLEKQQLPREEQEEQLRVFFNSLKTTNAGKTSVRSSRVSTATARVTRQSRFSLISAPRNLPGRKFRKLSLNDCNLQDGGCALLATVLARTCCFPLLEELELQKNGISEIGLRNLLLETRGRSTRVLLPRRSSTTSERSSARRRTKLSSSDGEHQGIDSISSPAAVLSSLPPSLMKFDLSNNGKMLRSTKGLDVLVEWVRRKCAELLKATPSESQSERERQNQTNPSLSRGGTAGTRSACLICLKLSNCGLHLSTDRKSLAKLWYCGRLAFCDLLEVGGPLRLESLTAFEPGLRPGGVLNSESGVSTAAREHQREQLGWRRLEIQTVEDDQDGIPIGAPSSTCGGATEDQNCSAASQRLSHFEEWYVNQALRASGTQFFPSSSGPSVAQRNRLENATTGGEETTGEDSFFFTGLTTSGHHHYHANTYALKPDWDFSPKNDSQKRFDYGNKTHPDYLDLKDAIAHAANTQPDVLAGWNNGDAHDEPVGSCSSHAVLVTRQSSHNFSVPGSAAVAGGGALINKTTTSANISNIKAANPSSKKSAPGSPRSALSRNHSGAFFPTYFDNFEDRAPYETGLIQHSVSRRKAILNALEDLMKVSAFFGTVPVAGASTTSTSRASPFAGSSSGYAGAGLGDTNSTKGGGATMINPSTTTSSSRFLFDLNGKTIPDLYQMLLQDEQIHAAYFALPLCLFRGLSVSPFASATSASSFGATGATRAIAQNLWKMRNKTTSSPAVATATTRQQLQLRAAPAVVHATSRTSKANSSDIRIGRKLILMQCLTELKLPGLIPDFECWQSLAKDLTRVCVQQWVSNMFFPRSKSGTIAGSSASMILTELLPNSPTITIDASRNQLGKQAVFAREQEKNRGFLLQQVETFSPAKGPVKVKEVLAAAVRGGQRLTDGPPHLPAAAETQESRNQFRFVPQLRTYSANHQARTRPAAARGAAGAAAPPVSTALSLPGSGCAKAAAAMPPKDCTTAVDDGNNQMSSKRTKLEAVSANLQDGDIFRLIHPKLLSRGVQKTAIQIIDLSRNKIGPKGAKVLADGINPVVVEEVNLDHNLVQAKGVEAILAKFCTIASRSKRGTVAAKRIVLSFQNNRLQHPIACVFEAFLEQLLSSAASCTTSADTDLNGTNRNYVKKTTYAKTHVAAKGETTNTISRQASGSTMKYLYQIDFSNNCMISEGDVFRMINLLFQERNLRTSVSLSLEGCIGGDGTITSKSRKLEAKNPFYSTSNDSIGIKGRDGEKKIAAIRELLEILSKKYDEENFWKRYGINMRSRVTV